MKDQRTRQDRAFAEDMLEEKGHQRVLSTQGTVGED
jgi:hypothetical protein